MPGSGWADEKEVHTVSSHGSHGCSGLPGPVNAALLWACTAGPRVLWRQSSPSFVVTVARALCATAGVVGATTALMPSHRPVPPRWAGSCSSRVHGPTTDGLTARLPRHRAWGLAWKEGSATTASRWGGTVVVRGARARGARRSCRSRGAPRDTPGGLTTLAVPALIWSRAPPSARGARPPPLHPPWAARRA